MAAFKRIRTMLGGMLFLLAAGAAQAADLASLSWLGGAWAAETKQGWIEERWAPARGGVMMGTSLTGAGGKAASYEFMRLTADDDGGVSLWASPEGKAAVRFRLVSSSAAAAAFENPAHDFPTRIAYTRSGRTLTATISGPGGSGKQSWRYRRR